jgi:RHS repeat-associated protein
VNVFINGLYWGLYAIAEKLDATFAQRALPYGPEASYAFVNRASLDRWRSSTTLPGAPMPPEFTAAQQKAHQSWIELARLAAEVFRREAEYHALGNANSQSPTQISSGVYNRAAALLGDGNLNNFIDYVLLNLFAANESWPGAGFETAYYETPQGAKSFIFTPFDAHFSMGLTRRFDKAADLQTFPWLAEPGCHPGRIFLLLMANPSFRSSVSTRLDTLLVSNEAFRSPTRIAEGILLADFWSPGETGDAADRYWKLGQSIIGSVPLEASRWAVSGETIQGIESWRANFNQSASFIRQRAVRFRSVYDSIASIYDGWFSEPSSSSSNFVSSFTVDPLALLSFSSYRASPSTLASFVATSASSPVNSETDYSSDPLTYAELLDASAIFSSCCDAHTDGVTEPALQYNTYLDSRISADCVFTQPKVMLEVTPPLESYWTGVNLQDPNRLNVTRTFDVKVNVENGTCQPSGPGGQTLDVVPTVKKEAPSPASNITQTTSFPVTLSPRLHSVEGLHFRVSVEYKDCCSGRKIKYTLDQELQVPDPAIPPSGLGDHGGPGDGRLRKNVQVIPDSGSSTDPDPIGDPFWINPPGFIPPAVQDPIVVEETPDPRQQIDFHPSIVSEDISGWRFRRLGLDGRPLPKERPQHTSETDERNEETWVDSLTLQLRHDTSDFYIPLPGGELSLAVKRSTSPELTSYDRRYQQETRKVIVPGEKPFGLTWNTGLAPHMRVDIELDENGQEQTRRITIIDENGSISRFAGVYLSGGIDVPQARKAPDTYLPIPSSAQDTDAVMQSLRRPQDNDHPWFEFRRKFGTVLRFHKEPVAIRLHSKGTIKSFYNRLISTTDTPSIEDRVGNRIYYTYPALSGSSTWFELPDPTPRPPGAMDPPKTWSSLWVAGTLLPAVIQGKYKVPGEEGVLVDFDASLTIIDAEGDGCVDSIQSSFKKGLVQQAVTTLNYTYGSGLDALEQLTAGTATDADSGGDDFDGNGGPEQSNAIEFRGGYPPNQTVYPVPRMLQTVSLDNGAIDPVITSYRYGQAKTRPGIKYPDPEAYQHQRYEKYMLVLIIEPPNTPAPLPSGAPGLPLPGSTRFTRINYIQDIKSREWVWVNGHFKIGGAAQNRPWLVGATIVSDAEEQGSWQLFKSATFSRELDWPMGSENNVPGFTVTKDLKNNRIIDLIEGLDARITTRVTDRNNAEWKVRYSNPAYKYRPALEQMMVPPQTASELEARIKKPSLECPVYWQNCDLIYPLATAVSEYALRSDHHAEMVHFSILAGMADEEVRNTSSLITTKYKYADLLFPDTDNSDPMAEPIRSLFDRKFCSEPTQEEIWQPGMEPKLKSFAYYSHYSTNFPSEKAARMSKPAARMMVWSKDWPTQIEEELIVDPESGLTKGERTSRLGLIEKDTALDYIQVTESNHVRLTPWLSKRTEGNFSVAHASSGNPVFSDRVTHFDYTASLSEGSRSTTSRQDGTDIRSQENFDGLGRTISTSRPFSGAGPIQLTSFVYDKLGRIERTNFPDGTSTETVYDQRGNALFQRDQDGFWTATQFDCLNRPMVSLRQTAAGATSGSDIVTTHAFYGTAAETIAGGALHDLICSIDGRGFATIQRVNEWGLLVRSWQKKNALSLPSSGPHEITIPGLPDETQDIHTRYFYNLSHAYGAPTDAANPPAGAPAATQNNLGGHAFESQLFRPSMIQEYRDGQTSHSYDYKGREVQRIVRARKCVEQQAGQSTQDTFLPDQVWTWTFVDAELKCIAKDPLGITTTTVSDGLGRTLSTKVDPRDSVAANLNIIADSGTHSVFTTNEWCGAGVHRSRISIVPLLQGAPGAVETRDVNAVDFDSSGRAVKTWQPNAETGQITFNAASSSLLQTSYDPAGNVIASIDPLGRTSNHSYDVMGRKVASVGPFAAGLLPADGERPETPALSGRMVTCTFYNNRGQVIETVSGFQSGSSTPSAAMDSVQLTAYVNTLQAKRYAYSQINGLGLVRRTISSSLPVSVEAGGLLPDMRANWAYLQTDSTYDANGNVTLVIDPENRQTTNSYDSFDRLYLTETDGIQVRYGYDRAGNRTSVLDGEGHETGFSYDGLNRLCYTYRDKQTPVQKTESISYKATLEISRNNGTAEANVDTYYDTLGRTVRVCFRKSLDGAPLETLNKNYDAWGNLVSTTYGEPASSNMRDTVQHFDKLKRLTAERSAGRWHHYRYDLAGQLTALHLDDPSGPPPAGFSPVRTLSYEYDPNGRMIKCMERDGAAITGTPDRLTVWTFDTRGGSARQDQGNGTRIEQFTDALGRLNRIVHLAPGSGPNRQVLYEQSDIEWDRAGNLKHFNERHPLWPAAIAMRDVINTYDAHNRLHLEQVVTGGSISTTRYEYDDANNRTLKEETSSGVTNTWNYVIADPTGDNGPLGNANQIMSYSAPDGSTVSLTYDGSGNRSTRTVKYGTTTTRVDNYAYDGLNRLTSLEFHDGPSLTHTLTFRYAYDARTRRVVRDESGVDSFFSGIGSERFRAVSTFSGGLSVAEYASPVAGEDAAVASATRKMSYTRTAGMGGGIGGLLYTQAAAAGSSPATTLFSTSNSRGDVVNHTNPSGSVTWAATYQAFGTRTQESGSTPTRQRANSKEEDPTGLLNEGFRYRDLDTGSFITLDPAGFVDGPNRYTYVRQNPWTCFDPEGLDEMRRNPIIGVEMQDCYRCHPKGHGPSLQLRQAMDVTGKIVGVVAIVAVTVAVTVATAGALAPIVAGAAGGGGILAAAASPSAAFISGAAGATAGNGLMNLANDQNFFKGGGDAVVEGGALNVLTFGAYKGLKALHDMNLGRGALVPVTGPAFSGGAAGTLTADQYTALQAFVQGGNSARIQWDAVNSQTGTDGANNATKNRVKPRKDTLKKVDEDQPRDGDGDMIDPNEGTKLKVGEVDLGHKPGNEWRVRKAMHEANGSTRKEVIEAENDPSLYQWEDRSSNRSHRHEQP